MKKQEKRKKENKKERKKEGRHTHLFWNEMCELV